ncbi:hypothetical protein [Falsiroseomonas oryzae]|uniref:hypothetical protein n=1 Tax=Falsiroseomonas oryzae TaxID=2766473 RepID=UPI0022EB27B2|nr:hypothetical protein [Roseomonas sp. MO-31]
MPSPSPLRSLRRLVADRRGASSLAIAASMVTVFGAAAIATDVGSWYAARRGAQNAADAGAAAATATLSYTDATTARTAARDVAARNGFTHAVGGPTTVDVFIPPRSGPNASNPSAVEVVVTQRQQLGASGYFLSSAPSVVGRSVATLRDARNVCVLALSGQLWTGGDLAINAPTCVLASNRRASPSIEVTGNSLAVTAFSLAAVASCQNCGNANVVLTERFKEWQPPIADPYVHLQSKTMPRPTNGCMNRGQGNTNLQPYEANGRRMICGDLRINGGEVLNLSPGTYYIFNGGLFVQGGGTLRCSTCTGGAGVTIVLTGDPAQIGGITINANSVVDLRAARTAVDRDYDGVLFYRDFRATTNNINNPSIDINGTTDMRLSGALYFPTSYVRMNGTAGSVLCSVVVAGSITFTGTADVTQCAEVGTRVPQTRLVMVAE